MPIAEELITCTDWDHNTHQIHPTKLKYDKIKYYIAEHAYTHTHICLLFTTWHRYYQGIDIS